MKSLVVYEPDGFLPGTSYISAHSVKNPLIVRRGEGGWDGWGGPLWQEVWGTSSPAGGVGARTRSSTLHLTPVAANPTMPNPPTLSDPPSPYEFYEYDISHRWWTLPPGNFLPLTDGNTCQLLFAGRPGGNNGPDVRDAVLRFSTAEKPSSPTSTAIPSSHKQSKKLVGDVEFHVRASDWYTHQHHTDARYNNVILHVVLICDDVPSTQRQDGATIPTCSLHDLHHLADPDRLAPSPSTSTRFLTTLWPCHTVIPLMNDQELARLLSHAGLLRFEQKTHAFVEQLHNAQPHASFTTYDTCLISALAEGLGYGRDRAFFRAAGQHLLGISSGLPEPLGRAPNPSPLDTTRLRILRTLITQWRTHEAWPTIRKVITLHTMPINIRRGGPLWPPAGEVGRGKKSEAASSSKLQLKPMETTLASPSNDPIFTLLRSTFPGLSPARTDILICNIVLPFAAAVALIENDAELAAQARSLYLSYSALPSNSITRAMCRQLQLSHEPQNACQQQGLHYIYAQTCREKHCAQCIAGRHPL